MTQNTKPTQQSINNRFHILKNSWRSGIVVPFYSLTPRTYFLTEYGIDINTRGSGKSNISQGERKKFVELWKSFILLVNTILKKRYYSFENLQRYTNRLKLHYEKYGSYKEQFRQLMSTTRAVQIGIVVEVKSWDNIKWDRRYKRMRPDTTERTFIDWIQSGYVILLHHDTTLDKHDMPTFQEFEVHSDITPEQAKDLIPYVGFGDTLWTSPQNVPQQLKMKDIALEWYLAWNSCLPTSDIEFTPMTANEQWETRQWTIKTVTAKKTISYIANVLVSSQLAQKLNYRGNTKITLDRNGWTIGSEKIPLGPDDFHQALVALSVSSRPTTLFRLVATPETYISINCGPRAINSSTYVDICKSEMAKVSHNETTKILLIAGKGTGKSTFINMLKDTSVWDEAFIEDSDDWGSWLSYLLWKRNTDDIQELAATMTEREAIDSVGEFYTEKSHGKEWKSHIDLKTRSTVKVVLEQIGCTDFLKVDVSVLVNVLEHIKPSLKNYLVMLNNLKPFNQKYFEDGIYTHMALTQKRIFISFLHTYLDNAKRRNQTVNVKFESGVNSIVNLSMRALTKQYTAIEYIADVCLQDLYNNASDLCLSTLTANQVLQMFGVVPVLSSDFKLKLLRDASERVSPVL